MNVQPGTRSRSTGRGLPLLDIYGVSLNDAFLVRYMFEGSMRSRCHGTAIDITGMGPPNLDPEVFGCNVWSKRFSYHEKHECDQTTAFKSMMNSCRIKENTKKCVRSSLLQLQISCEWLFELHYWMKAYVKPNDIVRFWMFTFSFTSSRHCCAP